MLLQLLRRRDFLNHDATGGDVPSVRVRAGLVSRTVSNHQSDTNGSFANPLTVSSNLTVLVNVGVCFAMVIIDNINRFDGYWFGTFRTIEGEIPTLTATHAVSYPEIAIKLDLQCCFVLLFDKDTLLLKEKSNEILMVSKILLRTTNVKKRKVNFKTVQEEEEEEEEERQW